MAVPTTTSAVTITTSPTVHQFYPVVGGNAITCIPKHPYPDNVELYPDIGQCYKEHVVQSIWVITLMKQHQHQRPLRQSVFNPTKMPSMHPTKLPSSYEN